MTSSRIKRPANLRPLTSSSPDRSPGHGSLRDARACGGPRSRPPSGTNDAAFGLPVPGDFASESCNPGANENISESHVSGRRYFGFAALRPSNDQRFSVVPKIDLDAPGHSRKRTNLIELSRTYAAAGRGRRLRLRRFEPVPSERGPVGPRRGTPTRQVKSPRSARAAWEEGRNRHVLAPVLPWYRHGSLRRRVGGNSAHRCEPPVKLRYGNGSNMNPV